MCRTVHGSEERHDFGMGGSAARCSPASVVNLGRTVNTQDNLETTPFEELDYLLRYQRSIGRHREIEATAGLSLRLLYHSPHRWDIG